MNEQTALTSVDHAAESRFYTSDGARIHHGLRVWDYDLKPGTVDFDDTPMFGHPHWNGWFSVRRDDGSHAPMNGERLRTRHPVSGEPVPALYPRRNGRGETVWACCESSIGPDCAHQTHMRDRPAT